MNKKIIKEYRYQKAKVWNESFAALQSARSIVHFEALEDMGLVKFEYEPEIEQYGLWVAVSYYLDPKTKEWVLADSIGMLIGEDAHCYESDIKQTAIDQLREANRELSKEWRVAS